MQNNKEFFCEDLSGREYKVTLNETEILNWQNKTDYNDVLLHDFVVDSEVGDKWQTNSEKVTRIK